METHKKTKTKKIDLQVLNLLLALEGYTNYSEDEINIQQKVNEMIDSIYIYLFGDDYMNKDITDLEFQCKAKFY